MVYIKDLNYDEQGQPVILYVLSRGYESGPSRGTRTWMTAYWTGTEWEMNKVAESDHNYDTGPLYLESNGLWRVIAPLEPGPQPFTTGGEMVMLTSNDRGKTWKRERQLTRNSKFNHTYARRPVNAHPDFYAFWADGDTLKPSESHLYFTNRDGSGVWRLPSEGMKEFEKPVRLSE